MTGRWIPDQVWNDGAGYMAILKQLLAIDQRSEEVIFDGYF